MKRFLMQSNKLASVENATTTGGGTSTSTDVGTFVDSEGFDQICVLGRVHTTTGDPTVQLTLIGATNTGTGTASTTALGTVSWTGGSTGDVAALQAQVGPTYPYFGVKMVSKSGKTGLRNLYLLGGARRMPIATTTTATEDSEHHVNTVKSTTVIT